MKSFLKSFETLVPPSNEPNTHTFRCLAYVSSHTYDIVNFKWTVDYEAPSAKTETIVNNVPIQRTGRRCVPVESLYQHKLTDKDEDGSTISCTAFGMTLSKNFTPYVASEQIFFVFLF